MTVIGSRRWGSVTDRGLVRAVNEDAFLADPPLWIVADGMGGHSAGDVASWLAVEAFADLVGAGDISPQQVAAAVLAANRSILDYAQAHPDKEGMGTTLSGLAAVKAGGTDHWMAFNVGDSRVYRFTRERLEQLTVDHSEVEELVSAGRMSREAARGYHRRHVVTKSLGTDPGPVADSWVFPPVDGERYLICSDGLTNELEDDAIRDCLASAADPQHAAEQLVALSLEVGGRDNITVIVVDGLAQRESQEVDGDTSPRPD